MPIRDGVATHVPSEVFRQLRDVLAPTSPVNFACENPTRQPARCMVACAASQPSCNTRCSSASTTCGLLFCSSSQVRMELHVLPFNVTTLKDCALRFPLLCSGERGPSPALSPRYRGPNIAAPTCQLLLVAGCPALSPSHRRAASTPLRSSALVTSASDTHAGTRDLHRRTRQFWHCTRTANTLQVPKSLLLGRGNLRTAALRDNGCLRCSPPP